MLARLLAVVFAVSLSCTPAFADIVVGPPGSGAPTASLNDAIFNADEGERIFVLPGEYLPFDLNGKSVQIIGAGADQVFVQVPEDGPSGPGSRIRGLDVDQQVFVSGLHFDVLGFGGSLGGCQVFDNSGRVSFHACDFTLSLSSTTRPLVITDCIDVLLDGCEVRGHQPEAGSIGLQVPPGDALEVTGSNVRFHGGLVRGGDAVGVGLFFSNGGAGVRATDSALTFHGTEVRGGVSFDTALPMAPAIEGTNTAVILGGAPGTLVQGGPSVSSTDLFYPGSPAVQFMDATSSLTMTGSLDVQGGSNSDGSPSSNIELNGSELVLEFFQRPGLDLSSKLVSPGESFDVRLDGESGAAVIVGLAFDLVPNYTLPGVAGLADLDPAQVEVLFTAFLPLSGSAELALQVPANPSLTGTVAWFQALQEGAPGGSRLSLPAALVVGQ